MEERKKHNLKPLMALFSCFLHWVLKIMQLVRPDPKYCGLTSWVRRRNWTSQAWPRCDGNAGIAWHADHSHTGMCHLTCALES